MDEKLLTPALSPDGATKPIYSVQAGFLVAFFGGPVATTLFSALNSFHQQRLKTDLAVFGVGMLLSIGFMIAGLTHPDLMSFGSEQESASNLRIANRILALALFGVYYLLHKRRYRAAAIFGEEPPSPWKPALACLLLAALVNVAVVVLLGEFQGRGFMESLNLARSR